MENVCGGSECKRPVSGWVILSINLESKVISERNDMVLEI